MTATRASAPITRQLVELIGVLFEVTDQELLDDTVEIHHPQHGMEAADAPVMRVDPGQEAAELLDVVVRIAPQHRHRLRTVSLDGCHARYVVFGAAERHRLLFVGGDHLLGLPDPVRDELGQVRPDLSEVPALTACRIRTGQCTRTCRFRGVSGQTFLNSVETLHEAGLDAHRSDRSGAPATTRLRIEPRRSTASSTTSPGCSHGYASLPWTRESSRMQPVPQVPEPITSPGCTLVPRDAYASISPKLQ